MIKKLRFDSVRNLAETTLDIKAPISVFVGPNGAGKTSILESINILGTGRSFRTHQIAQVIAKDKGRLQVNAILDSNNRLGIERHANNDYTVRINREPMSRLSILAEYLPVRTMTPESFLLLTAGAQNRRQFLDFCVFHVEHSYAKLSQTYARLLKQRNALLKQKKPYKDFVYWDDQISIIAEKINSLREETIEQLIPYFSAYQNRFLPQYDVQYSLQNGASEGDLKSQLEQSFNVDCRYGYTTVGPHKADIKVKLKSDDVHLILSRGELKMMVASMILGQVRWLLDRNSTCYLLLDDLVSELDEAKQAHILDEVVKMERLQSFITSIKKPVYFEQLERDSYQMFHVEHGELVEQQE